MSSDHTATVAGELPTGHRYCTCGRKVRASRRNGDGTWAYVHTSGKAIIAPKAAR